MTSFLLPDLSKYRDRSGGEHNHHEPRARVFSYLKTANLAKYALFGEIGLIHYFVHGYVSSAASSPFAYQSALFFKLTKIATRGSVGDAE